MDTRKDIGAAVKQRMDTLKDSPDDFVWANIEGELKKKKKRRALIFWSSGLGLGMLLLMLWIINPFNNTTENGQPIINTPTVDSNERPTPNASKIHSDSTSSVEHDATHNNLEKLPEQIDTNQFSENETTADVSEQYSNIKTNPHQVTNTKNREQVSKTPKKTVSKISDRLHSASNPNEDIHEQINDSKNSIVNTEKRSIREIAIAKRDSLIAENKKIRDSIKEHRQSERLVSIEKEEENIKDSILADDKSKWSISPQATLSYYGALNTKTSDNFSINYGILASYRMTKETYLRVGIRKLNLNQTIVLDSTVRNVTYLEFPLEIKYTPLKNKVNPYVTGGLSYFKLQNGSNDSSSNFEYKATMSLNLGLGLETKLFKKTYFNIETNFNYQLKPFDNKNSVEPFIFSIHTGIEYRF